MKAEIYYPDKDSFRWSPNLIMIGAFLLFFLSMFVLISLDVAISGNVIAAVFGVLQIAALVLSITSYVRSKPLRGKLQGEIEFLEDAVLVNGNRFPLTEINRVGLSIEDYQGKRKGYMRSFNAQLSQGVDNYLAFDYAPGKRMKVNFQLKNASHAKDIYPTVKALMKLRKIPLLRGIEILQLDDYQEIQELKKELGSPLVSHYPNIKSS